MENKFYFNYYEIIKIVVHFHYAHPNPFIGPLLFYGTVTVDRYVNMLEDEETMTSSCFMPSSVRQIIRSSLEDTIVRKIVRCDMVHYKR